MSYNSQRDATDYTDTLVAAPVGGKGPQKQAFTFDSVLGAGDGQTQVYETVEPSVWLLCEIVRIS